LSRFACDASHLQQMARLLEPILFTLRHVMVPEKQRNPAPPPQEWSILGISFQDGPDLQSWLPYIEAHILFLFRRPSSIDSHSALRKYVFNVLLAKTALETYSTSFGTPPSEFVPMALALAASEYEFVTTLLATLFEIKLPGFDWRCACDSTSMEYMLRKSPFLPSRHHEVVVLAVGERSLGPIRVRLWPQSSGI
jgi:hypothetical protein